MRGSLQGIFLGERKQGMAIVREQDAFLLTSIVELLPVCPPELPGFAGRQCIITPLLEVELSADRRPHPATD